MNINNINNNEPSGLSQLNLEQTAAASKTLENGPSSNASSVSGSTADSIALTSSTSLVQQALNAGSDSRTARVQQLKALVASNQYNPSAQEVSSALVNAHLAGV
jgi:flagellar biosynthesis anti-sigma factor FlgM